MNVSNFRSRAENSTAGLGSPVLTCAQVREVEAANAQVDMMRRAGRAAFEFLRERTTPEAKIVLIVGPGNNGGDALACAAELAGAGYRPTIVMRGDPAKFGADARNAWARLQESPSNSIEQRPDYSRLQPDWIVDGLFGIGLSRPIKLGDAELCHWVNERAAQGCRVLALDVPSGVDADTGALVGETAIVATDTITFIANKPGLLTGPALDHVGELHLASLGLDLDDASRIRTFGLNDAHTLMRPARANAHKGSNGTLTIVGGANGMLGAALLASRAAMRMGAGKVKVGWLADPFPQVDPLMPEVMMRSAAEATSDQSSTALVVGCGMGIAGNAVRLLKAQLKRALPLVLDADALNLIAESAELTTLVQSRKAATIITPHPAEAARLLGASTRSVQNDRLRAARDLAKGYHCVAVLKGAGTVVDNGDIATINTTGNPLLATAGTGDVLAGMIGALLAQGYDASEAARIGVALHGAAADALRQRGIKRAIASDIVDTLSSL
jgi:ADP-dependent NAD(P)H-hydrate dehydratase / NAD(P)H-hydrate epimerase